MAGRGEGRTLPWSVWQVAGGRPSGDRAKRADVAFTPLLRLERAGLDTVMIFGSLDDRELLLRRLVRAGLPLDAEEDAASATETSAATAAGTDSLSAEKPTRDTD